MILGDPKIPPAQPGGRTTLDEIFGRSVERRPDALALTDPPNRESFTDGAPRRLTFAQADRIVSAIAVRLRSLGLATDAVIGLQLPNTVESVLAILGVLRAGMIAAPMPLLWRRAEAVAALSQTGARAIVTSARIGSVDHGELAMHVAAEIFPMRHVCGFGRRLADGIIPFDELLSGTPIDPVPEVPRENNPAAHIALVTFDVTPGGLVAVARNHMEMIVGGLAVMLEARLEREATILSPCPLDSFGSIVAALLPWLLTGGTLSLHQPFDPAVFAAQGRNERCDTIVLPGPLAWRMVDAGVLDGPNLRNVLALWRSPERLPASPSWRHPSAALTDVSIFGEVGLFGARRSADRQPAPVPVGAVTAPRGTSSAVPIGEIARTDAGTLAMRGPMVPRQAFPPGAERTGEPHLKAARSGLVDTGYTCRIDPDTEMMVVTGPPPGIVSVGGYRFALNELQDAVKTAHEGSGARGLARCAVRPSPGGHDHRPRRGAGRACDTRRQSLARRRVPRATQARHGLTCSSAGAHSRHETIN